jgi:hypothetical protein
MILPILLFCIVKQLHITIPLFSSIQAWLLNPNLSLSDLNIVQRHRHLHHAQLHDSLPGL